MKRSKLILFFAIWLSLAAAGSALMLWFQSTPGAQAEPPHAWPAGSALTHQRMTLVMIAHPRCPCTRASLEELARIMARADGRLDAHVLFLQPSNAPANWAHTDLWRAAEQIPGVAVHLDDGTEAHRFHAQTSGQTLLYDAGALLFAGGITAGRGHAGDNLGEQNILALLERPTAESHRSPVYGCPLSDETAIHQLPVQ